MSNAGALQPIMQKTVYTTKKAHSQPDENECFICADHNPKYWITSGCGHRVCWMCSLRLRQLYGKTACPMCKVECDRVFIGKKPGDPSILEKGMIKNEALGLVYDTEAIRKEVDDLLKLRCPYQGCKTFVGSKADLKRHTTLAHSLILCDICMAHKKVFSCEQKLFTSSSLQRHQKEAHPICKLCGTFFFSDDELEEHRRDKHERCHICHRADPSGSHYFRDYHSLEGHFRSEHYLCPEKLCLDLKFVVFATEIEFKAHMAEVHLAHTKMQRSQQKQLTRIDPSFMVGTSSTASPLNNRRSNSTRTSEPTITTRPAEPINQRPPPPTAIVDSSRLFFGDSISALAGKLASFTLYEQRNDEFFNSLRTSELMHDETIRQLQEVCQRFQKGACSDLEWVRRSFEILGNERSQRVLPVLIELQLDAGKRVAMSNSFRNHVHKLEAFPPLPVTQTKSMPTRNHPTTASGIPRAPIVGTGGYKTVRLVSGYNKSMDKNPLGLSGFGTGIGRPAPKSTKSKPSAPVFSQAAATGTGKTQSSPITVKPKPSAPLDESKFPALPSDASPSKVAVSEDFEGEENFVIGGGLKSDPLDSTTGTKKKTKRQVVLRFG